MDCSPPASSVRGILRARIPEWVAIPFSRGSSWPRDWTQVSCIAGKFFPFWATREARLYQGASILPGGWEALGGGNWKKPWEREVSFYCEACFLLSCCTHSLQAQPILWPWPPLPRSPILLSLLEPRWGFDACVPPHSPCIYLLETLIPADLPQWPFPSFLLAGSSFCPELRWYLTRLIWTSEETSLWGSLTAFRSSYWQFIAS